MHVEGKTLYIFIFIYGPYRRDSDGKMYVRYEVIGANSVAVPTHFFKVIVAETADQKYDMEAYVMPNQVLDDSTPLTMFQVCGTQFWLHKLSDCDTSYVNVYIHDQYYIWQLSVATSCWILYCINIAHSASCPQAALGSGWSDEQQLSNIMMTLYIKHTCIIPVITGLSTGDKVWPTVNVQQ